MSLLTEVWINSIVEGLFADNSFLARSVDHSDFVDNKVVHVPNAGAPSNVEMDRTTLPAEIKRRTDVDLSYELHEFTTDPILIDHAETVELSYDKRNSVLAMDRANLHETVAEYILSQWMPTKDASQQKVTTKVTSSDIAQLQRAFNKAKLPQLGRVVLLSADAYSDLLESLTNNQSSAFLACADASKGVVGSLYGFDFLEPRYALKGALGLAWHDKYVSRALGDVKLFDNPDSATYYGSILSFLLRAGGAKMRSDEVGVMSLVDSSTASDSSSTPSHAPKNQDEEHIGV